jgi:hypothetical protein
LGAGKTFQVAREATSIVGPATSADHVGFDGDESLTVVASSLFFQSESTEKSQKLYEGAKEIVVRYQKWLRPWKELMATCAFSFVPPLRHLAKTIVI